MRDRAMGLIGLDSLDGVAAKGIISTRPPPRLARTVLDAQEQWQKQQAKGKQTWFSYK